MHGVQRRGLPGSNGSYGERQGVPEVGLQESTQTPLPTKKVSTAFTLMLVSYI